MKVCAPSAHWMDDDRLSVPTVTILEREGGWRKSGLLDQYGNDLMIRDETNPVGFVNLGTLER